MVRTPDRTPRDSTAAGFTLIELLVVIGIIGVLIALSLAAGSRVVAGAKGASTADTIRVLEQAVEAYVDQRDELPPPYAERPAGATYITLSDAPPLNPADPYWSSGAGQSQYSAADLAKFNNTPNGLSWFIYQVQTVDKASGASQIIDSINPKVRSTQLNDPQTQPPIQNGGAEGSEVGTPTTGWKTVRVFDSWGRQIRFVHPKLDGEYEETSIQPQSTTSTLGSLLPFIAGQRIEGPPYPKGSGNRYDVTKLKRSGKPPSTGATGPWEANSDGGSCIGNRPYFYSEGADGKPFTPEDNIYATKPRLPVYDQ